MAIIAGTLCAAMLFSSAAYVQAQTPTPSPAPEGVVPAIVRASSSAATWLSGLAEEYAGSPLWTTIAGIVFIVLIVSLFFWLRRPKEPSETRAPM